MPILRRSLARKVRLSTILSTLALAAMCGAGPASAAAAGAYTAPDDPAVPALITSLRDCLKTLPADDQRALTLRAGLGGAPPQLSPVVAAALARSPSAELVAEVAAIRKLEAQRRRGACNAQPAPAAAQGQPAAKPASVPTHAARAATTATGGSTTDALAIAVPAILALAFLAGMSRETLRHRRS